MLTVTYDEAQSARSAPDDESEYPVLVRATNGKAVQFETVVSRPYSLCIPEWDKRLV